MKAPSLWRWITLVSYFGLMIFLFLWVTTLAPPQQLPKSIALAIALLPLLPSLRGILHARPYTHAWTSFIAMPYFAYGVDAAVHRSSDQWLGLLLVLISLALFLGCILFARFGKPASDPPRASE